ncbi:MAG: DUF6810 family protein [Dehalococcoidia bacterium]
MKVHILSRTNLSAIVLISTLFAIAAVSVACGSDESSGVAMIPRISDSGEILSLTDLEAIGFKKSKTYDVEGLTGADSAYFGFWGLDPYERKDYEVRFFPSHSDAVELGTALASERVGKDAKVKEDNSSWPVGLKDARRCTGSKAYSGPQNCLTPKYWDFSIYANMIVLCSGGDFETAQLLCNEILMQLEPQSDPV